jgi:putative endonuclease
MERISTLACSVSSGGWLNSRQKGQAVEDLTGRFLRHKGYTILHRNWTCFAGEIDIIATYPPSVAPIFVEVKSAGAKGFCDALEQFTWKKRRHLLRAINQYLYKNRYYSSDWRLDLVCLTKVPGRYIIEHFEDVLQV